jgi:hypothetical protein
MCSSESRFGRGPADNDAIMQHKSGPEDIGKIKPDAKAFHHVTEALRCDQRCSSSTTR